MEVKKTRMEGADPPVPPTEEDNTPPAKYQVGCALLLFWESPPPAELVVNTLTAP